MLPEKNFQIFFKLANFYHVYEYKEASQKTHTLKYAFHSYINKITLSFERIERILLLLQIQRQNEGSDLPPLSHFSNFFR